MSADGHDVSQHSQPSCPPAPSLSCSPPLLPDSDDDSYQGGWVGSDYTTTASPASSSPLVFMTDSNQSAPTPPPTPPATAKDDAPQREVMSRVSSSMLAVVGDRDDDLATEVGVDPASTLTFPSSFFSSCTTTSESTGGSSPPSSPPSDSPPSTCGATQRVVAAAAAVAAAPPSAAHSGLPEVEASALERLSSTVTLRLPDAPSSWRSSRSSASADSDRATSPPLPSTPSEEEEEGVCDRVRPRSASPCSSSAGSLTDNTKEQRRVAAVEEEDVPSTLPTSALQLIAEDSGPSRKAHRTELVHSVAGVASPLGPCAPLPTPAPGKAAEAAPLSAAGESRLASKRAAARKAAQGRSGSSVAAGAAREDDVAPHTSPPPPPPAEPLGTASEEGASLKKARRPPAHLANATPSPSPPTPSPLVPSDSSPEARPSPPVVETHKPVSAGIVKTPVGGAGTSPAPPPQSKEAPCSHGSLSADVASAGIVDAVACLPVAHGGGDSDDTALSSSGMLRPPTGGCGVFDMDDVPLAELGRRGQGDRYVSPLSQLAFLFEGDVAEQPTATRTTGAAAAGSSALRARPSRAKKKEKGVGTSAGDVPPADDRQSGAAAAAASLALGGDLLTEIFGATSGDTLGSRGGPVAGCSEGTEKTVSDDVVAASALTSKKELQQQREQRGMALQRDAENGLEGGRAAVPGSPLTKEKVAADMAAPPPQPASQTTSTAAGHPCLWIEVTKASQEEYGSQLRHLLVWWGCVHAESSSAPRLPVASASGKGVHRPIKRARTAAPPSLLGSGELFPELESDWATATPDDKRGYPFARTCTQANDAIVILLCAPTVSVAEILQWWTRRAHVAHAFMPPLFAVSVAADGAAAGSTMPPGDGGLASPLLAVHGAAAQLSVDLQRSIAVVQSWEGRRAFAPLLPHAQVYPTLDSCIAALGAFLSSPLTPDLCAAVDFSKVEEDVDVSSLAAVLASVGRDGATAARSSGAAAVAGQSKEEAEVEAGGMGRVSRQDRCFDRLCQWSAMAARLRRLRWRPQLLLWRTTVSSTAHGHGDGLTQPVSSVAHSSRKARAAATRASAPANASAWVTFGLVRPATRNEDTFADTAHRAARLLASHAPPVTLLPAHLSAITAFAAALFTRDNYNTAVGVVVAHARVSSPRRLGDFISGYGCVATGPLCYTVSATVRRYLHVQLSIDVATLLGLADFRSSWASAPHTAGTLSCATRSSQLPAAASLAAGQWRQRVTPALSCTCRPGVFEQVPHTPDGVKVCRHLAELFYYFTTQQFRVTRADVLSRTPDVSVPSDSVEPPSRAAEARPRRSGRARAAAAKHTPISSLAPPPPAATRTTTAGAAAAAADAGTSRRRARSASPAGSASSSSDSDLLVDTLPLSVLYSSSGSLAASADGGPPQPATVVAAPSRPAAPPSVSMLSSLVDSCGRGDGGARGDEEVEEEEEETRALKRLGELMRLTMQSDA